MIKGLKELNKKFKQIEEMDLSKVVHRSGLRVERDAKSLAPVDTGLLRSSINTEVKGNTATVGTSVEYAPNVEFGIGQRPQPYLTPAFYQNREIIKEEIAAEVRKQLEDIANG